MMSKLNKMVAKVRCKAYNFMYNEKGDTNFISILVILAIVTTLITAFIGFKDQIIQWVNDNMGTFFGP